MGRKWKKTTSEINPPLPPYQKTVSGIDDILKDLNLSKYSTCFQTLNFEEFKDLTDNDLKDLGISLIGPRRKLSSRIASLNSTQN
jgi:hypothetical protein